VQNVDKWDRSKVVVLIITCPLAQYCAIVGRRLTTRITCSESSSNSSVWSLISSNNENDIESGSYIITPDSIMEVRSLFSIPPELVTPILDYAQYWVRQTSTHQSPGLEIFYNCNTRYLRTPPLAGGQFTHPLRQVVITTLSKDQGWSSDDPRYHGTREASWTWFELTLEDHETGEEKYRTEIVRNIHAGTEVNQHVKCINDSHLIGLAEKGDTLSVWVRAMYMGWSNQVRSVTVETFVAY
jgi:hypothetical protein